MQLFKTEMMFLHPPRIRPVYGARSKRVLRYGGRLPVRTDPATLPRCCDDEASSSERLTSPQPPFGVEWAA